MSGQLEVPSISMEMATPKDLAYTLGWSAVTLP